MEKTSYEQVVSLPDLQQVQKLPDIPTGGGISASKSHIDSHLASVTQQTALQAGDGGFQVDVQGNTDLQGAVISSTQNAVERKANSFTTGGTLTTSDIQNTASFSAKATGVSINVGTQDGKYGVNGVGAGIGSNTGQASSTTTAGISGIAGNTTVRTGNAETGLQPIFDAGKVQRETTAQVAITQAFSKQAPMAVATFSANKITDLKNELNQEADPIKRAAITREIDNWSDGGTYRVALHTAAGAFGGGLSGAAGGAVSSSSANLMNDLQDSLQQGLQTAGLGDAAAKAIAQGVTGLTAAGMGAVVAGTQGAATALTVDANNRQLHPVEIQWIASNRKAFAEKLSKEFDRTVPDSEAMYWLNAAGESNVDANMQRSNSQFVRGTSNTEDSQSYDMAKAFIADNTKTGGNFVDERGQTQNLFRNQNGEFYKPDVYSQWKNDANYRDYYWDVMSVNLKGDNLSLQEQALYDQRQQVVNTQTVKQLALLTMQAATGKIASNVAANAMRTAASKSSATEFAPALDKPAQTAKPDGDFQTLGLNNVNPLTISDGVKMVRAMEKAGLSQQEAFDAAKSFISSGATHPVATPLDVTDKLVKVVPSGGRPSAATGYWMRESELSMLQKDTASMFNKLGLPPGMQVNAFDVFQITPRQGALVFESRIAPTTVDGILDTTGGAKQSIVVDRTQFTSPVKVGSITVK